MLEGSVAAAEASEPVILGGKYRLLHKLVEGGMGSVWRAEHMTLHSPVAVKLITPDGATNDESLQRFLLEARAGAALRSPHVVQIFDYGLHDGLPYIVMELLNGESLADRLDRLGSLGARATERVVTQVARALTRAHAAGVIHRDLKPENIFLVDDDDDFLVKLLDFGIAKSQVHCFTSTIPGQATRTGTFIGTPSYASPEQIEGVKTLDHRTDIWSMGVVAFECLLGRTPFEADAVGKVMVEICSGPLPIPSQLGHVPEGFDLWFSKICARDPEQRFQSAREAAAELSALCGAAASEARWQGLSVDALTASSGPASTAARIRRTAPWIGFALASAALLVSLATDRSSDAAPSSAILSARAQQAAKAPAPVLQPEARTAPAGLDTPAPAVEPAPRVSALEHPAPPPPPAAPETAQAKLTRPSPEAQPAVAAPPVSQAPSPSAVAAPNVTPAPKPAAASAAKPSTAAALSTEREARPAPAVRPVTPTERAAPKPADPQRPPPAPAAQKPKPKDGKEPESINLGI